MANQPLLSEETNVNQTLAKFNNITQQIIKVDNEFVTEIIPVDIGSAYFRFRVSLVFWI